MIVVDSSIWDAAKMARDRSHSAAIGVLEKVMDGAYGRPLVTDYIIDEVLAWLNAHSTHRLAAQTADWFLSTGQVEIEKVDWAIFNEAADLFRERDYLSFTDSTTAVIAWARGIKDIASLDRDFIRLGFKVISGT